jgi:Calx-beta domain/Bacterial Ig-like domain (group 3)/FG-GAP-like repeat/Domain of unknown function (DUF4214)
MWRSGRSRRSVRSSGMATLLRRSGFRPALEALEERTVLSLFTTPPSVFLGNNTSPQSITSGDFRGDGGLDVAVANHGTHAVSVLLSNGNGTFGAPAVYSLGSSANPTFITSANLNADNKPDLIVVDNSSAGFVDVLINNGDGTFATPVKYAVGANPEGVAVADMNGDSKPDLIVANNGGSSLTVLLNQGDGTFVAQSAFTLPAAPVSITAGDFNNDTKNDVAVVAGTSVYVYSGLGNGSFNTTPTQLSAGTFPGVIAAGHFRNPNELDLAVVDVFPSSTGVAILLNNGTGTFASAVLYDLGASPGISGGTPNSLAIGDLNGDGIMDLAVADDQFANNEVSVLLGNADGTFGNLTSWVADQQPTAVVIGSFVGDAHADLAVVNQASNDISFLAGNGDGTFVAPQNLPHISSPGPVVTGDFTGDSKQDVIVGNTFSLTGTILTMIAGNGNGTFQTPTTINNTITNPTTGQPKALAAALMNNDSSLDLVMLDGNNNLDVFFNNGSGVFATPVAYSAGSSPQGIAVGDFNGDHKPDVAIIESAAAGATDGSAMIYLNDGTGALTLVGQAPDVGLSPTSVTAADLDGDGKDDLVVTNNNGFSSTVSVLISSGSGDFNTKVSYAVDGDPTDVAAAPLRIGGKPDLAVSTFFGPGLDILLNNGDGTFGASKSHATGSNPVSVTIDDVTRDGIPDVLTTNNFGDSITLWTGVGNGTFAQLSQSLTVGDRPAMTAAANFNNDGFLDLVTTNGNANDITFLLTGSGPATISSASSAAATYSTAGQTVSLSATVTSVGTTVNEGTETFTILEGATAIGSPVTVAVVNGAANASFTLPGGTPAGSYVIQASYNGTVDFASSSDSSHTLVVGSSSSSTAASSASATFNTASQNVGLSATVTSASGVVNEGTETFTLLQGATPTGTPVTVNVANGVAPATYSLPAGQIGGSYTIQATYNGTGNITGSTDAVHSLVISAATTSTSANSLGAVFDSNSQVLDLNASVTSNAGAINEGTETFTILNGNVTIGTPVTVNVANGAAEANYTLPGGTAAQSYVISAVYNGTGDFGTSTDAAHTLTIQSAQTTTSGQAASTSFTSGSQNVQLQATFTSPAGPVSGGTATFAVLNGGTVVGAPTTAGVSNGAATVNYAIPGGTVVGTYTIQVSYNGTSNFAGSGDNSQSLTIGTAATSTSASNAGSPFNSSSQNVTLTATITSSAGTVNEGTETFTVLQGATPIGSPVTVNVASGAASASYVIPAGTAPATYTIQAVYSGTSNLVGSADSSHTLTVGMAATNTVASAATVVFSSSTQNAALSATVTSASGTVNEGTETFTILQGSTTIGSPVTVNVSAGTAAANYPLPASLAVGNYVIQAVYTGAGNFATSADSGHSLTVGSPGQIQFSTANFSANESDSTATITITRTGGSAGPASVSFATGGGTAPAGVDYTANTTTVSWAAGDQSSKTVHVNLINHNATGSTTETVGLTLSQAQGATLGTLVSSTLTIQETASNSLASQLNFSVAVARVARNAGNGVITIIRTGGLSGTITVQFATSDGTASAGSDYTTEGGTLTFGPNVTAQTISIPLLNTGQTGNKTLNVTLSNPGGGAVLLTPSSVALTITDPLPVQAIPKNLIAIANDFTHAPEALSIFVTNAYRLYLKRLPDSQGISYWIDQLQNHGLTDEKLETGFISSTEYIQNHGGTGQAWVIGMYQDLLGRNPDQGGLTYWTGVLSGGGSAFTVALGFAASAEREGQRIAGDYQIFLGRQLDPAGQAFWVNQFLKGARNEDVVAGFLGSAEYYQNSNKGQSNHMAWVDSAFQDMFNRDPSASELANWLSQMT